MVKSNEDSRVKSPALLHLTRLGYKRLSLLDVVRDTRHNIFPAIGASGLRVGFGTGQESK